MRNQEVCSSTGARFGSFRLIFFAGISASFRRRLSCSVTPFAKTSPLVSPTKMAKRRWQRSPPPPRPLTLREKSKPFPKATTPPWAFAHGGVVAFGKGFDFSRNVSGLGGGGDLCQRRFAIFVGDTKGDVFANGVTEQESLLRNEADMPAKKINRKLPNRAPVDEHTSWFRIVDTGDQVDERRLAGSGGADDGQA